MQFTVAVKLTSSLKKHRKPSSFKSPKSVDTEWVNNGSIYRSQEPPATYIYIKLQKHFKSKSTYILHTFNSSELYDSGIAQLVRDMGKKFY